jgi:hypothetical protein
VFRTDGNPTSSIENILKKPDDRHLVLKNPDKLPKRGRFESVLRARSELTGAFDKHGGAMGTSEMFGNGSANNRHERMLKTSINSPNGGRDPLTYDRGKRLRRDGDQVSGYVLVNLIDPKVGGVDVDGQLLHHAV